MIRYADMIRTCILRDTLPVPRGQIFGLPVQGTSPHALARSHFRPRSPLNLLTFGAVPALEAGLAVVDERSGIAPSPVVLPSNRSQGATSAFRGVGPVLPPPIARRAVGGSGQSIVEAALEATLGLRCASD
jgi:hypothetical protein